MKHMKRTIALAIACAVASQFVFAQGQQEATTKADANAPVHITLWYPATQTEVGPLPNDWVGYQIVKDKFNIDIECQSLPSGSQDQDVKIQAAAAADDLSDMFTAGREGVEYTLDAEGNPQSVPGDAGYNGPVGQTYIQLRGSVFNYQDNQELSSRYPSYITKVSHKHMSALETLHTMQARPWTDATGMESMPVPSTDLKTFYEQGIAEFLAGRKELTKENWDAFVKQFGDMGGKAWEEEGRKYAEAKSLLR